MLMIRSILLTRRRNKPNFKVETRGEEVRFVHDAASRTKRRVSRTAKRWETAGAGKEKDVHMP